MPRVSCRPAFVPPKLTIGSLFAGVGGIELGLEWSGVGRTIWQVEKDAFCQQVLAKWWPTVPRFEDVKTVGAGVLPYADLICGGFPCVDISYAGKGAGLAGERSGLWFEYERIVREMGPRFVVVENVAALRSRGLGVVLGALASLGYDAEWRSVRASDVGAPHKRERVFIVAWLADPGRVVRERPRERGDVRGATRASEGEGHKRQRDGDAVGDRGEEVADPDRDGSLEQGGNESDKRRRSEHCGQQMADAESTRRTGRSGACREYAGRTGSCDPSAELGDAHGVDGDHGRHGSGVVRWERSESTALSGMGDADVSRLEGRLGSEPERADERIARETGSERERRRSLESFLGRDSHGIPDRLDRWPSRPGEAQHEWEPPRTIQVGEVSARSARLKALGNAVVPQVVAEFVAPIIFRVLREQG